MMKTTYYDLTQPDSGMNYRWIQPPQIAYFVTTVDAQGNVNSTPVTLGTCVSVDMDPAATGNFYFTFALGNAHLEHVPARHGFHNLEEVPECVISYIGAHLLTESQAVCLPLPPGISEIDAAGLTELPSRHVRPPGIAECLVNIEARVVSSTPIGQYYQLYVCQAVGVSVRGDLVELDNQSHLHAGALALDPLYEVTVLGETDRPPRLYYIKLDPDSVVRMPDHFGPQRTWVGSFENWLEDEVGLGRLTDEGRLSLLELNRRWQANPDPQANAPVKAELTQKLRELVPAGKTPPLQRKMG